MSDLRDTPAPLRKSRAGDLTIESLLDELHSAAYEEGASIGMNYVAVARAAAAKGQILARLIEDRAAATRAEPVASDAWLVWSDYHEMWWRANRGGYTFDLLQAGIYTEEEAVRCASLRKGEPRGGDRAMKLSEALARSARSELNGGTTVLMHMRAHPDPIVKPRAPQRCAHISPPSHDYPGRQCGLSSGHLGEHTVLISSEFLNGPRL